MFFTSTTEPLFCLFNICYHNGGSLWLQLIICSRNHVWKFSNTNMLERGVPFPLLKSIYKSPFMGNKQNSFTTNYGAFHTWIQPRVSMWCREEVLPDGILSTFL
jgi:hypothetical protein